MSEKQNINEETPPAAQAEETEQTVNAEENEEEEGRPEDLVCPDCGVVYDGVETKGIEVCEDCGTTLVPASQMPAEDEDSKTETIENGNSGQKVIVVHKEPEKPKEPVKEVTLKLARRQISAWNDVIKVMLALNMDEATFSYNGNISVKVMDPSRISMVVAEVDAGSGISAIVTEKPAVTRKFTCNMQMLKRALRMDDPTLEIGQDKMLFRNSKAKVTVPLVDDSDENIPEPKLKDGTVADYDFDEVFKEMTKYLGSAKPKPYTLTAESGGIPDSLTLVAEDGKAAVKCSNDSQQSFEMTGFKATGANATAYYNTQMLKALKGNSYGEKWVISFSTDMPLMAKKTFNHTDYDVKAKKSVDITDAKVVVYLAPRLSSDD